MALKFSIVFVFFALPFEIPVMGALYLSFPYFGEYYRLFHPIVFLALWLIVWQRIKIQYLAIYWIGAGMIVAGSLLSYFMLSDPAIVIVHAVLLASAFYVSRAIWSLEMQRPALVGLITGMSVYAFSGILVYLYSLSIMIDKYPFMGNMVWDEVILRTRFIPEMQAETPWYDWVGNLNKTSNTIVLCLLLGGYAFLKEWISPQRFVLLSIPIVVLLIILFSRGAFVALIVSVVIFMFFFKKHFKQMTRKFLVFVVVLLIPAAVSFSTSSLIDYWADLGTVASRLHLLENAISISDAGVSDAGVSDAGVSDAGVSWLALLLGYGIGGYGMQHFGSRDGSTHNLFLDVFFDYGLLGILGLIIMLARGINPGNFGSLEGGVSFVGIAVIVLLGFREYSLVYLDVSIMGAMLLGLFAVIQRTHKQLDVG